MSADLHLSRGIGFAADYFSEVMHQLRAITFTKVIADFVEITGNPSVRDERSILKLAAMYKLLRPDGEQDREVSSPSAAKISFIHQVLKAGRNLTIL